MLASLHKLGFGEVTLVTTEEFRPAIDACLTQHMESHVGYLPKQARRLTSPLFGSFFF